MSRFMRTLGALSLVATLGAGCSLALDFGDECAATADCEAVDRAYRCERGFCVEKDLVQVPSDDPADPRPCTVLFGSDPRTSTEPTILVGTILPKSGQLAAFGPGMERAVELAVEEINQNGGVLGQKLGVLACNSGTSPDVAIAAARHLVDVGKVDAIIGAAASSITIDVFNAVVRDAGALLVSSAATSPAITNLPDEGRLWRTVPSDAIQGRAIARYLEEKGYGKIAVVNRDDAYGNGLASAIQNAYCASRDCNPNNYINRIYTADSDDPAQPEQHAQILTSLQTFAPDVVVLIAFLPDGVALLNLAGGPVPWDVVVTDGMKDPKLLGNRLSPPDPNQPGLEDTSLLCNLVGTNPASPSSTEYQSFALKYQGRFGQVAGTYTANSYDALYLIGLAYAAARGANAVDIDGRALAEGLTRVTGGEDRVVLGLADWNKGVTQLSGGPSSTIDVEGASGPLEFDAAVGEAPSGIELWRVDVGNLEVDNLGVALDALGTYNPGVVPARVSPDPCAQ